MDYHCLIASLPNLQLENTKLILSQEAFVLELESTLDTKDKAQLNLLLATYDNAAFISLLEKKQEKLSNKGVYTIDELEQMILLLHENEETKDKSIPLYFKQFYQSYIKNERQSLATENLLSSLYYEYAIKKANPFLASWFEFNLNLQNIMLAQSCRKYNWELTQAIIGNNEVAENLRSSKTRDFGLKPILEDIDLYLQISEETNLLLREQKIETLRWQWLENHSFFHYFSVEHLLAYLLKTQILERRLAQNKELGKAKFETILNELIIN